MQRDARVVPELLNHPTVKALRQSLGAEAVVVAVALLLWAYGRQGNLGKLTPRKLAALGDYPGSPDILFDECVAAGLIERSDDGLVTLPDWREFFPYEAGNEARREAGRRNVAKRTDRRPLDLEPPEPVEKPAKRDPVPYQQIVDAYHEHFPAGARVRIISSTTKAFIASRWKEDKARQDVGWWVDYFIYCQKRDWLVGKVPGKGDRKPFVADLAWLVRPTNMEKVINGRYE